MGTLKEDIVSQSKWIVKAFAADNLKLDYSINSFIAIDQFIGKHSINGRARLGGRLRSNLGSVLFSIGSYIGETIIKNVPGASWITDDKAPDGEITVSVLMPDGTLIFPVQRIIKRFKNGIEDSIYVYGYSVTSGYTNIPFNDNYWISTEEKPWWKFW
ncbi:hypothetical protein [Mucilaginibacter sp.]|uniref:hypothetical protein n=1 Tax=Mucilaginibacter sp. TaxID=1882438 RepID=UPI00326503A8